MEYPIQYDDKNIDKSISDLFDRQQNYDYENDLKSTSKRVFYLMLDKTMMEINKLGIVEDADLIFKNGGYNNSYSIKYEFSELFINLYRIINDNKGEYKKETAFDGIRKYYEHILNSQNELKDFQKLILDWIDIENEAEMQARQCNEIFNNIEFILSYLGENNNNEIILKIINSNLCRCVKSILLDCENLRDNKQFRLSYYRKKQDISKSLEKLSVDNLNKAVCKRYMKAIQYIIDTFFYSYDNDTFNEAVNTKKEFYENKIKQYPRRRPLRTIDNNGLCPDELDKVWSKYMIRKPCRFKMSNSDDWEEYCRNHKIKIKNEQVEVESYKEKKFKYSELNNVTEKIDETLFAILLNRLSESEHGLPEHNLVTSRNCKINMDSIKIQNYINKIISMLKNCKDVHNQYIANSIRQLIESKEFIDVANALVGFECEGINFNNFVIELWLSYFEKIQKGFVTDDLVNLMETKLLSITKEYTQAIHEITNQDLHNVMPISQMAFKMHIIIIQNMINSYIGCKLNGKLDLFGYESNLVNYCILGFPFYKTFVEINQEITSFQFSELQCPDINIDIMSDKDDAINENNECKDFSYFSSEYSCSFKIKFFKAVISSKAYNYVKRCSDAQNIYLKYQNYIYKQKDVSLLSQIFSDILDLE